MKVTFIYFCCQVVLLLVASGTRPGSSRSARGSAGSSLSDSQLGCVSDEPESSVTIRRATSSATSRNVLDNISMSSRMNYWNPMSVLGKRKGTCSTKTPSKGGKKKSRVPTWTHTFVCLAETDQDIVPDPSDRASLQMAGLGEKKIQFDGDSDAHGIHEELLSQFPKLRESGGYELMRTQDKGSKLLNVIDVPPSGYSATYLKAVAHSARIFIRPLQRDLSLLPEKVEVNNYFQFLYMYACSFS